MATVTKYAAGSAIDLPRRIADSFAEFGDLSAFGGEVIALSFRLPARGALCRPFTPSACAAFPWWP